jgi:hypothetical protein
MPETQRNRRGEESDETLLETIKNYPGLSQYELGQRQKWKAGHVDGSIRRLLNENRVFIRVLERNGRRVNLIYPKDRKPLDIIEVPTELLDVSNPSWGEGAFFYALDSSTIGISGHEMPEWAEVSCFMEKELIQIVEGNMVLRIPERFWRFYNLERKHRVVSINGNSLLLTISGDIIEEKKYPS